MTLNQFFLTIGGGGGGGTTLIEGQSLDDAIRNLMAQAMNASIFTSDVENWRRQLRLLKQNGTKLSEPLYLGAIDDIVSISGVNADAPALPPFPAPVNPGLTEDEAAGTVVGIFGRNIGDGITVQNLTSVGGAPLTVDGDGSGGGTAFAQFVPAGAYTLSGTGDSFAGLTVNRNAFTSEVTDDMVLELQTDAAGAPSGVVIPGATITITPAQFNAARYAIGFGVNLKFYFATPVLIPPAAAGPSDAFHVVFRTAGAASAAGYVIDVSGTIGPLLGTDYQTQTGGGAWVQSVTGEQPTFSVFVGSPAVAELETETITLNGHTFAAKATIAIPAEMSMGPIVIVDMSVGLGTEYRLYVEEQFTGIDTVGNTIVGAIAGSNVSYEVNIDGGGFAAQVPGVNFSP